MQLAGTYDHGLLLKIAPDFYLQTFEVKLRDKSNIVAEAIYAYGICVNFKLILTVFCGISHTWLSLQTMPSYVGPKYKAKLMKNNSSAGLLTPSESDLR